MNSAIPEIINDLNSKHITKPTIVQENILDFERQNVLVQSETGSGKTICSRQQ